LADSIYALLNYPAISKMSVRCGADEVNRLKWDNAALKIKDIYSQVIAEAKR
jgi:hypothetical protein